MCRQRSVGSYLGDSAGGEAPSFSAAALAVSPRHRCRFEVRSFTSYVQAEERWHLGDSAGGVAPSFSAAALAVSPCLRYLVAAATSGHMLVCALPQRAGRRAVEPSGVRNLPVLTVLPPAAADTFFLPAVAWHPQGGHIIAADAGGRLLVRISVY